MKTLHECLADYDTTMLRAIAERRGVEVPTSRPQEMAAEIASALLKPESIDQSLTWLTGEERRALDLLMASGGRMRIHRFEQQAGEIRRFGPGSLAREAPWRSPANPAEGLWYQGLIARGFAQEAETVVEFAFIPDDLRPLLPPSQAGHEPFEVSVERDPDVVDLGGTEAVDDVCTLLGLAYAGELHNQGGQLEEDSEEQALAQLLEPDRARLGFLLHVARAAGLLRPLGRSIHIARDRVRRWLEQARTLQLRVLQEAWRGDDEWNDLWHVPGIRCEETGWRNDPLAGRAAVLDLVGRCPRDAWLSIRAFVGVVRELESDYLRPDGDFGSWYIRDVRSGEYLVGFEHWDQIEGALLAYLIAGPLHWLGMVSLGRPRGWEKPAAFRLTTWGAAFLGLPHDPFEDLPPQPARVSPDATVTVPQEASLSERFQLARIAEWRASGPEYVYQVTPASLGRALGEGIQVERVERFLRRISDDSVPAAGIARIRDWASHYGHVRLRRAAILEARSAGVMGELRANARIRGYLRQAVSPTVALVRDSDWEALIAELHRAGYLPEIIEH